MKLIEQQTQQKKGIIMEPSKPIHPFQILRRKHSLNQSDLGQLVTISANLIAQIEQNYTPVPDKVFASVTSIFKIDPKKLDRELKDHETKLHKYLLNKIK